MECRGEFAAASPEAESYLKREHNARWAALGVAHATNGINAPLHFTLRLMPALATRIDEMPHLDRLRFKTTHVFLKVAVSSRQSLVLSQVLRPRFDDERFDVERRMLGIAIDA